jgi:hypothetical protein
MSIEWTSHGIGTRPRRVSKSSCRYDGTSDTSADLGTDGTPSSPLFRQDPSQSRRPPCLAPSTGAARCAL